MNQDLHMLKVTVTCISPNESMLAVTQLQKFHYNILRTSGLDRKIFRTSIAQTANNSNYFRWSLRVRVIEV